LLRIRRQHKRRMYSVRKRSLDWFLQRTRSRGGGNTLGIDQRIRDESDGFGERGKTVKCWPGGCAVGFSAEVAVRGHVDGEQGEGRSHAVCLSWTTAVVERRINLLLYRGSNFILQRAVGRKESLCFGSRDLDRCCSGIRLLRAKDAVCCRVCWTRQHECVFFRAVLVQRLFRMSEWRRRLQRR
jgi:hypothetical protein